VSAPAHSMSHSAGDDVAVNLSSEANENNAVTGGISFVPFQLVIGHGNFCPVRNDSLSIRDDGHVMIMVYLEKVSLVCVGLATARYSRVVGLFQISKPLSYMRRRVFPLPLSRASALGTALPATINKGQ
jgi:hypothetical protein